MTSRSLTPSELISVWENGDGPRPSQRILAMLSAAEPEARAEELLAMPAGARDAGLLALREELFGSDLAGVTGCPACGEQIELTFAIEDVRAEAPRIGNGLSVQAGGYDVAFRLPNGRDLASIERMRDVAAAREQLLARCVLKATHDDQAVEARGLPEAVVDAIAAAMAEADPQGDVRLDVVCPECAHVWREPFDIALFLWNEVASAARHLLGDVHCLASAYGWSESEILRLSPARLAAYLEMAR